MIGDDAEKVVNEMLPVDGHEYRVTLVNVGNPHCVVFVDDVDKVNLAVLGPKFENHPLFPKRINTEFVQVLDKNNVRMRVWERGSGETAACGTGACAVLVAAVLTGRTEREATVHLPGGDLAITWQESDGHIHMNGPAEEVFRGEIEV